MLVSYTGLVIFVRYHGSYDPTAERGEIRRCWFLTLDWLFLFGIMDPVTPITPVPDSRNNRNEGLVVSKILLLLYFSITGIKENVFM